MDPRFCTELCLVIMPLAYMKMIICIQVDDGDRQIDTQTGRNIEYVKMLTTTSCDASNGTNLEILAAEHQDKLRDNNLWTNMSLLMNHISTFMLLLQKLIYNLALVMVQLVLVGITLYSLCLCFFLLPYTHFCFLPTCLAYFVLSYCLYLYKYLSLFQ